MPPFSIYDYVNSHNLNTFKQWSEKLQKRERAKLNERIDKLEQYGNTLYPDLPTDSGLPGILKIRCTVASVQLRPLLCRGPINNQQEYTLLFGAKEKGDKWDPKDAREIADKNKKEVLSNSFGRRIKHERVV